MRDGARAYAIIISGSQPGLTPKPSQKLWLAEPTFSTESKVAGWPRRFEEATPAANQPADPTDPGDAADLSTPQGIQFARTHLYAHDGRRSACWDLRAAARCKPVRPRQGYSPGLKLQ